jgi:hypothetical protein
MRKNGATDVPQRLPQPRAPAGGEVRSWYAPLKGMPMALTAVTPNMLRQMIETRLKHLAIVEIHPDDKLGWRPMVVGGPSAQMERLQIQANVIAEEMRPDYEVVW